MHALQKRVSQLKSPVTAVSAARPRRSACRLTVAMGVNVTRWNKEKQGPATRKAILQELRDQGYSCTTYNFSAGTEFGDHSHPCDKKDAILSGKFYFRMGRDEVRCKS